MILYNASEAGGAMLRLDRITRVHRVTLLEPATIEPPGADEVLHRHTERTEVAHPHLSRLYRVTNPEHLWEIIVFTDHERMSGPVHTVGSRLVLREGDRVEAGVDQ